MVFGGTFAFFFRGAELAGSMYTERMGATKSTIRSRGELEYRVVARRMAPTLRKKSTAYPKIEHGLKNEWRA